ncbi:MAG: hypothetical protein ACE5KM_16990 [Planctomycetaceae bacterium]
MSDPKSPSRPAKPFVGVHMKCCNTYVRAYMNAEGNAFTGWCPRCAMPVRIEIAKEGGSESRFFEAS